MYFFVKRLKYIIEVFIIKRGILFKILVALILILNVIFLTNIIDNLLVILSIWVANGIAVSFLLFDKDEKDLKESKILGVN